jgi:type 1 fimbriae regulatory protein FimE
MKTEKPNRKNTNELFLKHPISEKSACNVLQFVRAERTELDAAQAPFSEKSPKLPIKTPPRKPKNADRRSREYLTPAEVQRLIKAAKESGRWGQRDAALILIAYRHALRVGELVDLKWDQINLDEGKIHINRSKRGDSSAHYLEGDEIRALRILRREHPDSPFVFCSERKGPMCTRAAFYLIARAGEKAGIEFPVHPHVLRHAKGYQLASKGIDTRAIQAYLGHRNIQHTTLYTQLDATRFKGFGKD